MANTAQARKRVLQNTKRRLRNMQFRSKFRTYIKKVLAAIDSGDKELALTEFKLAQSVLDSIAGKGIVHKNKAARYKSRLSAKIKAMAIS